MDVCATDAEYSIEQISTGCVLCQRSAGTEGLADWQVVDVNCTFERLAGRNRQQLLGRSLREVLPVPEAADWTDLAGEVDRTKRMTMRLVCLRPQDAAPVMVVPAGDGQVGFWFLRQDRPQEGEASPNGGAPWCPDVLVGREKQDLQELAAFMEELLRVDRPVDLEALTRRLTALAGARFGVFCEYDPEERMVTLRHVAGGDGNADPPDSRLHGPLVGRRWPMDPGRGQQMPGLEKYSGLESLAGAHFPAGLCEDLSRAFGPGPVVVQGIHSGQEPLGEVVFLLPPGSVLQNHPLLELYARQTGLHLARMSIERKLREKRDQLQTIVDLVPYYIFLKYADGEFILANKAIAQAFGTTPEDMAGKRDDQFDYSAETIRMFRENERRLLETRKPRVAARQQMTTRDGRTIWRRAVMIPYRVEDTDRPVILGG